MNNALNPESARVAAETAARLKDEFHNIGWQLLLVFVLGSFTSALWTLRDGKIPKVHEIVSSALVSGMFAVAFVALLFEYNLSPGRLIFISIMCGFSGDVLIRVVVRAFLYWVKKFFADNDKK